jgi:hypothetical protein
MIELKKGHFTNAKSFYFNKLNIKPATAKKRARFIGKSKNNDNNNELSRVDTYVDIETRIDNLLNAARSLKDSELVRQLTDCRRQASVGVIKST